MYFTVDLQHLLLIDVLVFLARKRASGVLVCQNGNHSKQIQFSGGSVVSVVSNQVEERFGNALLRRGILTQEDLERALDEQAHSNRKFGEILISLGILDRTSMSEELVAQAASTLASLFSWQKGSCSFESTVIDLPPDHMVWIEIEELLFRSIRQLGSPLEARVALEGVVCLPKEESSLNFSVGKEAQALLKQLKSGPMKLEEARHLLKLEARQALRLMAALDVVGALELPLAADPDSLQYGMLAYYRSVLDGFVLQSDVLHGTSATDLIHQEWSAGPLGQQGVAPTLETLLEVKLSVESLGLELENSIRAILGALKEKWGQPMVVALLENLDLISPFLLQRNQQLAVWLEQLRARSPLASLEPIAPSEQRSSADFSDLDESVGVTSATALDYEIALLEEAKSRMAARDYSVASVLYQIVLSVEPHHGVAVAGKQQAERKLDESRVLGSFLESAQAAEQAGRFAEGLSHIESALRVTPGHAELTAQQTRLYRLMMGRLQQMGGFSCRPKLKIPMAKLRYHSLELNEGFLVSQVDGTTDLQGLALISGMDMPTICRLVVSLSERGILELPEPAKRSSP